ncbi:MAG: hypothetical protein ABIU63_03620 [Chitinophagaceae bacterium]
MEQNSDKDPKKHPAEKSAPAEENKELVREEIKKDPLAPFDPRLKKPGEPLQSNEDPLNGVNE